MQTFITLLSKSDFTSSQNFKV